MESDVVASFIAGRIVFYYDNATSISITQHVETLVSVQPVPRPFRLSGIGEGILVTDFGYVSFFPRRFALCYYSKDASASLISLGHIQRQGGSYLSVGPGQLQVNGHGGQILDVSSMLDSHLYPVSSTLPGYPVLSSYSTRVVSSVSLVPLFPSLQLDELTVLFAALSQDVSLVLPVSASTSVHSLVATLFSDVHVNREQRVRCDRAEMVHYLTHASDDSLCQALDVGGYSWARITAADVRLNRRLRGPCISCTKGKFHRKSMPPSETPPATRVGELISFDTQSLLVKSSGGNLCYIDSIDEHSGDVQVTPVKTLKSVDLFNALMSLVHWRYNAHGHRVTHLMSDSLPALISVVPILGAMGILLTMAPPGQHAQRL
jgi:hypothetical protein